MEIKTENKVNENGSYSKTTIIKTAKEDGWNDKDEIFSDKSEPQNRYFKGKATSIKYETNDPKITRPFTIIACIVLVLVSGIMLAISLIFKIFPLLVMGIAFLITTIVCFINIQREINKIKNELNKK